MNDSLEFDRDILDCIKRGLSALGENSPSVILYYVYSSTGLHEEEIASQPRRFERALGLIFGQGAAAIQYLVVEQIGAKFGLSERISPSVSEAIDLARSSLGKRSNETQKEV